MIIFLLITNVFLWTLMVLAVPELLSGYKKHGFIIIALTTGIFLFLPTLALNKLFSLVGVQSVVLEIIFIGSLSSLVLVLVIAVFHSLTNSHS